MSRMKNFVKVSVFAILAIVTTIAVAGFLKDKNNYAKYNEFYIEEENFDVLFFGSSRMLDAVYPMQLWACYGITSYNMSQHSENLGITYWQMKNAFEYNTPKVAVVDISLYFTKAIEEADNEAKSYLHKSLDHWKLSKMKYDALEELLADDVDKMEYLIPFSMYHYRWNELESQDVHIATITQKGAESKVDIFNWNEECEWKTDSTIEELTGSAMSTDIMERIVELCNEYGVEVIFTYVPSISGSYEESVCAIINYYEKWFEEQNVLFMNLARDMDNINYSVDFNDVSHVNCSGAKKITDLLGKYLLENYTFTEKNMSTVEAWEEDKEGWIQMKKNQFQQAENNQNINQYLLLMNDIGYSYVANIPNVTTVDFMNIQPMLSELGMNQYAECSGRYMCVKDGVKSKIMEQCDANELDCSISIGDIYFSSGEDGAYYYYCTTQGFTEKEDYKMQFFVFDNETKELIDQACFY